MSKFQKWIELKEVGNRPASLPISDRTLEGFRPILDQLQLQMKGVFNVEAKTALQPIVNDFYQRMRTTLLRFKAKGIGYSPTYQPNVGNALNMPNQQNGTL